MDVIWLHFVHSFLAITRNLTRFLKDDVKQMKDTRGYFNKISSDLDSSLNKNSAVSKSKPNEIEECTNLLQATQSCFRYTALDYVYQVRKKEDIFKFNAPLRSKQSFWFPKWITVRIFNALKLGFGPRQGLLYRWTEHSILSMFTGGGKKSQMLKM